MKKLLSLTAVALHFSISPSVNAQNLPPAEEFILLAELTPPAIPALPASPAIPALAPRPTAQTKIRPAAARLSDLAKPIEPIMALPVSSALLTAKPVKTRQADPLGDLVHTLMMDPLPLNDLLATHPTADLAKPRTADPLGDMVKPLAARPTADLAKPQTADPLGDLLKPLIAHPLVDLEKPQASDSLTDSFGNLADGLETTLVLEPVPPASIDALDDRPKTRAQPPH